MVHPAAASTRPKKSTTVRVSSKQQAVLKTARPLLNGLSRLAPEAATRMARHIFLRPPRHTIPERELWWATEAEEWDMPFGTGKLAAWRWGWGGEKILLVHGWGGRGLQLGAFAAPLVDAGYEVVTFDAPGHGRSAGAHSSLPEMVSAVTAMAHHLGGVKAIIAHSAGAAAVTAALGQPGTLLPVERLVYVAPSVDMIDVTRRFARTVGFTSTIADRMREGIEHRFGMRFADLQGLHIAPRMERPLLVLHDRGDRDVSFSEGEALSDAWPGAILVSTEGLGHRRILREAAVTTKAVRFIADS